MSYPRNEFEVDYRVPNCKTPECDGVIDWKLDDKQFDAQWLGECDSCGATYEGPTEAQELWN